MAKRHPITKRAKPLRDRSRRPVLVHVPGTLEIIRFLLKRISRRWASHQRTRVYFFLLPWYFRFKTATNTPKQPRLRTLKLRRTKGTIYPRISWWKQLKTRFKSKKKPTSHRPNLFWWGWRLSLLFIATTLIGGGSYSLYQEIFLGLPEPTELSIKPQSLTTKILDRNNQLLYRVYEDENRTLVPLKHVSPYLIQATIAIEDKEFYQHRGISVSGITRAFQSNLKGESVQGGSTITQQLVKLRLLSPERTLLRKIREAVLAIKVERNYSKDQILEMYLNHISYGGSTYGIEEAAQRYFNKPAHALTLAESALLAGLPAAPSVFTPFGTHPDLAKNRQLEVLRRMVEDDFISQEQADLAKQEALTLRQDRIDIEAPHFVMYVRDILATKYGEDVIYTGGLEVRTTLDLPLQHAAQEQVTQEVDKLKKLKINNGAALVTNPSTGEILAMIGSTNYFDFEHDGQVNVTLRPRQPGSSIKPLTYSLAFERGLSPSTLIDDTPITYQIAGSKPYSPKNYDGNFHGRVSLRQALASSYNIPAVKLLASVGIDTMINKGQAMGIDTWGDRNRFGLSLTLGGGEVTMADLSEVYGTFANYGSTLELNPILEIKDSQGKVLYQNECALKHECGGQKTLDTRVAFQVTDVLSDNNARVPAFGTQSVLQIPNQQVAVKTGTTNNLRDNWTIGYTSDRLVAVWVGNNDNTPMSYVASGITGASPIWNNIMRLVLNETEPHYFASPESLGLMKVAICSNTGTLPCAACPHVRDEYFVPGTEPTTTCHADQFITRAEDSATSHNRNQVLPAATTAPQRRRQGG